MELNDVSGCQMVDNRCQEMSKYVREDVKHKRYEMNRLDRNDNRVLDSQSGLYQNMNC